MTPRRTAGAGLLVAFVVLTLAVRAGTVQPVDRWIFEQVVDWRHPLPTGLARAVTDFFSPPSDIVALLLAAGLAAYRRRSFAPLRYGIGLAALLGLVVQGLKVAVGRPAPGSLAAHQFLGAYPSGHTASIVVCGAVIVLLLELGRSWIAWLCYAATVALVSTSLVVGHYHWFTDVVGSLLAGGVIVLAVAARVAPPQPISGDRAEAVTVRASPSG